MRRYEKNLQEVDNVNREDIVKGLTNNTKQAVVSILDVRDVFDLV